jgi:hypothetical protein
MAFSRTESKESFNLVLAMHALQAAGVELVVTS